MLPLESTCVPLTLGSRTQPGAASGGDLTDRESGRGRGRRPEQGMPMSEMLDTVAPQQQEPLALHDATVLLQRVVTLLAAGVPPLGVTGDAADAPHATPHTMMPRPGTRDQLRLQCVQLLYTLVLAEPLFQRVLVSLHVGAVLHALVADAGGAAAVRAVGPTPC